MAITITPALMTALFQGFNTAFQSGLLMPSATYYQSLVTSVPSSGSEELYGWLAQSTGFREWKGDRNIQDLRVEGYTLTNRDWEDTVGVDRNVIEDDRYGVLTPVFQQLGLDAKEHPDQIVFAALKDGINQKCYDGKPFFSDSHPVRLDPDKNKTTAVSNHSYEAGGKPYWYVFDNSKVLKPMLHQMRKDYTFVRKDAPNDDIMFKQKKAVYGSDARLEVGFGMWQYAHASNQDLTAANFKAVRAAMRAIRRDNGRPANARPVEIHVPTSLESAAEVLFTKQLINGGETNELYNAVKVVVNPYLDS